MYYNDVLDLIGNTPLMCLKKSTGYNIFAKAEFLNPGGSIKDRIAKNMLEVAESEGKLKPGMTPISDTELFAGFPDITSSTILLPNIANIWLSVL